MENTNLTICQKCNINPAVYGDGITWSRCSKCYRLETQDEKIKPQQDSVVSNEGFEHRIIPDLTSIILPVYMLNYTLFHYTGNCIGSIREHTNPTDYELVVVDNGSPLTPPELTSYYAHKVIKNEKNLGVTKAWNQGIRASFGEYIVLLNNDVQVFEGWLEGLRKGLAEGYDLVMAHPMYSLTEPFARAVESKKIREARQNDGSIYSDFKDFSCVMFKRSLIDEIGLFDENFFNYCSDSDFFKRLEGAGKKWACVDIVATSHISDATGYSIPETPEIMNKDKEVYEEKWGNKKETTTNEAIDINSNDAPPFQGERLVRTQKTGNSIYYVGKSTHHHIKDPETLRALGFEFGDEKLVSDLFGTEGEEINMSNYKHYV